ncbi:MAG: hypothetical protein JNK05_38875 [Myxococcales bacterium]|nr:hypothetical protein [Myxococcales bacterium]
MATRAPHRRATTSAVALAIVAFATARADAQVAPVARVEPQQLPPCARPSTSRDAALRDPRGEGERLLLAIEAHRLRAMALLAAARRARDIVRVQCVFDRTTQLESLQTLGREGFVALEDAVALRDRTRSEHSLRVLQIYQQRAFVLANESAQCAAPARRLPRNETVVTFRAPPSVADVDE